MITNKPTITPQVVPSPFKNFCQSIGAIPTSYQDSLDYYETVLWLIKFLDETVLPTVNTNGEAVAELQSLYIQLHDFVDNYFANLDVQEEINNKLDAMVEDGTLEEIIAEYLSNNAINGFDTVADMVLNENLINGAFAITKGYYQIGDGGGAKYSIRTKTNGDVEDGGSIIELANNLVAELIVENDNINVAEFGIRQEEDMKEKFLLLVDFVETKKIGNITFPSNASYDLTGAIVINTDKLTIWGNNTNIYVQDGIYRALRVYGDTLNIYDLTFNGADTRQDQWEDERYPGDITNIYVLNTDCKNVYLNNFNILNIWGQGIMALDYNNYIIENCTFNKIGGGFYYTDPETGANDNFGDALHFGGHNGIANIIINNFYAEGYTTEVNGGRKSRGGLVIEDFVDTTYEPVKTFYQLNNCELINFNRVFHYEGPVGPTVIKMKNGKIIQDASICVPDYRCDLYLDNVDITHTPLNYGGTRSFRGFNAHFDNCNINIENGALYSLAHASRNWYNKCVINNVSNTSLMNGKAEFKECTLNINGLSTYFMYNSTGIFKECTFNNSDSSTDLQMTKSGTKIEMYGCTFNNVKPYGLFKDMKNVMYLTSSTINDDLKGEFCSATIYKKESDVFVLKTIPNINQVFNATDEINIDTVFSQINFGSDATVPLFPYNLPDGFVWKPNSKYLMILYGANADYLKYTQKFSAACYFCKVRTNNYGEAIVYETPTASTDAPSGYQRQLDIDITNNTIAKGTASSNVSRVMYWILPFNYLNEIGTI